MENFAREVKVRPDSNHWLATTRPDLEKRLDRKARYYTQAVAANDAERALSLKTEVVELMFKVFSVEGRDVVGGVDDTFLNIVKGDVLSGFDPAIRPFSHYVRYVYAKRRHNPLGKDDEFNKRMQSIEASPVSEDGNSSPILDKNRLAPWQDMSEVFEYDDQAQAAVLEEDALARSEIESSEDVNAGRIFIEVVSLVMGFLDHKENGTTHTYRTKLYTKLFFTEAVTRVVKSRDREESCQPFEKHERDAFRAMELPFLDTYMAAICRSIRSMWRTPLREGFGEIELDDTTWQLPGDLFIDYVQIALGESVTRSAISGQRKNFGKRWTELLSV